MEVNQSTSQSTTDEKTHHIPETKYVLHRRFDRMGRLIGDEKMEKLMSSHVMIIGLGGVGSWAAESIARSGVGKITLVDFDDICITNANRQLHALTGLVGKKKAHIMAERLQKINPQAKVVGMDLFYHAETSEQIFADKPDYVIDAIDNITAKCHLIATAKAKGIKVIMSGGSGSKIDPTKIKVSDLSKTNVDPLCSTIRKLLRQNFQFPRDKSFGVPCVWSDETPRDPVALHYDKGEGFKCVCPQNDFNLHSCDSRNVIHGTASFVTGAFGLNLAGWVVRDIVQENN
ncbi:MAG: tRNA threonylcarbamoyladenosine dehydratase [Bdellovibrionaceae bacterium]|nr:tRNA threonylcarbamoyladenosine dehydratase [Pseudobdellovibrionaceae bacterium]